MYKYELLHSKNAIIYVSNQSYNMHITTYMLFPLKCGFERYNFFENMHIFFSI